LSGISASRSLFLPPSVRSLDDGRESFESPGIV